MSNYIDYNELNEFLTKVDIVKVVGNYLNLTQKGRNYVGLCPFHDDTNPSLSVSPEKRIYKCFVCGAGGNSITFVQDYEKMPFMQALQKVSQISGLKPAFLDKVPTKTFDVSSQDKKLFTIMDNAMNYYKFQLKVDAGKEALKYLTDRSITQDIIEKNQLGYALKDGKMTINFLTSKGATIDDILDSGLALYVDGEAYDMMRDRIIFPIMNHDGKVVAYSGRRIDNVDDQKYINSHESPIFQKSKILYNYHNASLEAKRKGHIYVLEGFFDVIALQKAGINNCVATMGTALTYEHLNELAKLKCEVRFLFDNDKAGINATLKTLDLVGKRNLKIKIVAKLADDAKDCDEFLQKYGIDKLKERLEVLIYPLEYQLEYLGKVLNLNNHEDRKKYAETAVKYLNDSNPSSYDLEYYINMISQKVGFSKELIRKNYNANLKQSDDLRVVSEKLQQKQQIRAITRYEKAQRQLIKRMIEEPLVVSRFQNENIFMYDEVYRRVCSYILEDFNTRGSVSLDLIITKMPSDLIKELLDIIDEIKEPVTVDVLFDTLKFGFRTKLEIEQLKEKMLESLDPIEQAKIAQEIVNSKKGYSEELKRRMEKTEVNKGEY